MNLRFLIFAAVVLPACAAAPPAAPPAPRAAVFGYGETAPTSAIYTFADSSGFNIQGGGVGNITATIGSAGTATVTYTRSTSGLEASIAVTDFAGSMTNSAMGGGPTATEADITGAAVVTLTPAGAPAVTSVPTFSNAAQSVGMNKSFFRRFFIRLPGRAVAPGGTWVDTLNITDESGGSKAEVTDVQTSTFVKDTVVNGRTLALITTVADRKLNISGANEGVEMKQTLTGRSSSRILWDAQRGLLVERVETSELAGTFDLPQMGMSGLPVTARSDNRVTLQ
jgi:hypothetical protein